jgi:hypothetical protein
MNTFDQLEHIRRRHGLSQAFAERFLPLLERAQRAQPEVRDRIIELVEASFAREASRVQAARTSTERRNPTSSASPSPAEVAALELVAKVLHSWQPPPWMLDWGQSGKTAR